MDNSVALRASHHSGGSVDSLGYLSAYSILEEARNPHNPDNEFHPFPRLPLELRRMIWKECLPSPKVNILDIEVIYPKYGYRVRTPAPAPIILHVNSEAREEAFRYYRAVPAMTGPWVPKKSMPKRILAKIRKAFGLRKPERCLYLDFRRDTFFFNPIFNILPSWMYPCCAGGRDFEASLKLVMVGRANGLMDSSPRETLRRALESASPTYSCRKGKIVDDQLIDSFLDRFEAQVRIELNPVPVDEFEVLSMVCKSLDTSRRRFPGEKIPALNFTMFGFIKNDAPSS